MKKSLIVVLALCLLILAGCGSLRGTGADPGTPTAPNTSPVTNSSSHADCQILQARQVQLEQKIQAVTAQISAVHGDQNTVRSAEMALSKYHKLLAQYQAESQTCATTR